VRLENLFVCFLRLRTCSAVIVLAYTLCAGWTVPGAAGQVAVVVAPPAPPTVAPPVVGTCATSLTKFVNPIQIATETPASFYEGSIVSLQLGGTQLDTTWKLLLCPKSSGDKTVLPTVGAIDTVNSKPTLLKASVTAAPGTAGTYAIYVADTTGKVYDTTQSLVINSSNDETYTPCSAPGGKAPVNANLQCSFSPMSYQVEYDAFGKGVADRFIAVYVVIQNKNQSLEYLLQDVRGGFPDYIVSSYDKSIPQDVSVKAEQFSARAIIFRLTSAAASVITGVAGFATSTAFQEAANIFAGPG
jgi:hypothetical protein